MNDGSTIKMTITLHVPQVFSDVINISTNLRKIPLLKIKEAIF